MANNLTLQEINKIIVEINGQFLDIKINLAKGYLNQKDAQIAASLLEQQLKYLIKNSVEIIPIDEKYRKSLKDLKSELKHIAGYGKVEDLADIPEDVEDLKDGPLWDDGSEFLPD